MAKLLERLRRRLESPKLPWALAALSILLLSPSLFVGLQGDDLIHRVILEGVPAKFPFIPPSRLSLFSFCEGIPEKSEAARRSGLFPWFMDEALRVNFWRPLTSLTHGLDYALWPNLPSLAHLHSLLWNAALVVAAALLYRRMFKATWVAGLAALLYAISPVHAMPAGWIANRNAVTAAFFVALTLLWHDRWRRGGWRPGAALAPAALATGLLCGEGAVAAGGYLLAHALFLDPAPWPRRLGALGPHVVVGLIWSAIYKATGHGAFASEFYIDPVGEAPRFLRALAERWPTLTMGQFLQVPVDVSVLLSTRAGKVFSFVCWGLALGCIVLLTRALRRDPVARFFALGMGLAAAVIAPIFGLAPSEDLAALREGIGWNAPRRWAAIAMAVAHLGLAPIQLPLGTLAAVFLGRIVKEAGHASDDPEIDKKWMILANMPSTMMVDYIAVVGALTKKPWPERIYTLAPSNHAVEYRRLDERTLAVRPERGFYPPPGAEPGDRPADLIYVCERLERIARSDARPMTKGKVFDLQGLTIEVTELTADQRPAEAVFRFERPLEDPRHVWRQWLDGRYQPFQPPKVGETMKLDGRPPGF